MASICARIRELFAADRAVILHAFSDDGMFTVAFSTGCEEELLKNLRFGKQDRLIKWLLTNETAMVVGRDQGVLDFLSERERQMLTSLDVRVCVPLIGLNKLTGLILISSTDKHWTLSDEDLSTLEMLASQSSIAFENAYLYRQQRDRLRKLHRTERLAAAGQLAASLAHEIRNPLTAIRSTVPLIIDHFLDRFNKELGLAVASISSDARRLLETADWPGNVRELENAVCSAMIMCEGGIVTVRDLPLRIRGDLDDAVGGRAPHDITKLTLAEAVREVSGRAERMMVISRLAQMNGNRTATAESLGISRKTLFNKMRQFGMGGDETEDGG